MTDKSDVLFARIILKKGWLTKVVLEKALLDVKEIKKHDSDMTLAHYLGVKEILPWDTIELALKLCEKVKVQGEARAAASTSGTKRPRVHQEMGGSKRHKLSHGHSTTHRKHDRVGGSHSHGRSLNDQEKPGYRKKKKQNNTVVVGAVLGGVVLSLIVILIIKSQNPPAGQGDHSNKAVSSTSSSMLQTKTSPQEEISYQQLKNFQDDSRQLLKRANAFLKLYPQSVYLSDVKRRINIAKQSLASDARSLWGVLQDKIPAMRKRKEYLKIDKGCRNVIASFPDTSVSKQAASEKELNKRIWIEDAQKAVLTIEDYVKQNKLGDAFVEATILLGWCPEEMKQKIKDKRDKIEKLKDKSIEIAMVDDTKKESTTGNDAGTGTGNGSSENPSPAPGAVSKGGSDSNDPKGLEGFFPGSGEKVAGGKDTGTGEDVGKEPVDKGTVKGSTSGKKDSGSGLFGNDKEKDKGPANNPVAELIKKNGLEKVQQRLKLLFHCSDFELKENGYVKVGYSFYTRSENLGIDWTPSPAPAKNGNAKIRWSGDWEGDLMSIVRGIRISDSATFINMAEFFHEAVFEVEYHNAQGMKQSTHLISGLYDVDNKVWYGVDVGNWAVKTNRTGRLAKADPKRRDELVPVGKKRWFKMEYKNEKVTAYTAYAENRSYIITSGKESMYWRINPNYRKGGELKVTKVPKRFYMGLIFYPNIVGTIDYVRMGGFLNSAWFEKNKRKLGF